MIRYGIVRSCSTGKTESLVGVSQGVQGLSVLLVFIESPEQIARMKIVSSVTILPAKKPQTSAITAMIIESIEPLTPQPQRDYLTATNSLST